MNGAACRQLVVVPPESERREPASWHDVWHPFGMRGLVGSLTGGAPIGDHRLISWIPPGSKDIALGRERSPCGGELNFNLEPGDKIRAGVDACLTLHVRSSPWISLIPHESDEK
jgi:hypothetical protein